MEKNMKVNFQFLEARIKDALEQTDLERVRFELQRITSPTLVSGVGGSSVVSEFTAKVLEHKNGIITRNVEPRDFIYGKQIGYNNVIACSYSGNNYGVDLSFNNDLKKYLLSNNSFENPDVTYLEYKTTIDKERSFISLGATLIPVSVILDYYLNGKKDKIEEMLQEHTFNFDVTCDAYEIFSGYDTSTASKYLESTITEAGIGIPVVHDKYSYCHGRSTMCTNYNTIAIYYNRNTEFDVLMLEELKKYHQTIIVIDSKQQDPLLADYDMLIQTMYLTKYIAEQQKKDLSKVEYNPIVKKLYKYSGEI
jgi:hypothetical protein